MPSKLRLECASGSDVHFTTHNLKNKQKNTKNCTDVLPGFTWAT